MVPCSHCECKVVDKSVWTFLRDVDNYCFSTFAECSVCFSECKSEVLHIAWTAVEKDCVIEVFAVVGIFRGVDFHVESTFSCDVRHSFGRLYSVLYADAVTVFKKFLEQCASAPDRKNLSRVFQTRGHKPEFCFKYVGVFQEPCIVL